MVKEGIEAIISIKGVWSDTGSWNNQNGFSTLTAGTHYLKNLNNNWGLNTISPDVINELFYRSIIIEDVVRLNDWKGDIDTTWIWIWEGLLLSGAVSKKITVHVEWKDIYQQTKEIDLTTYLINWGNPLIFAN